MPITHVGTAGGTTGVNVATLTPTLPTHIADDLLVVLCCLRDGGSDPGITAPANWTLTPTPVAGGRKVTLCWRVAPGAGTASPVITFANLTDSISMAIAAALRGVDAVNPIDTSGTNSFPSALDMGPVTAVQPSWKARGVVVAAMRGGNWDSVDVLSGDGVTWSEIGELETTAGNDATMSMNLGTWTGNNPKTLTSKVFNINFEPNNSGAGLMVNLNPAQEVTVRKSLALNG